MDVLSAQQKAVDTSLSKKSRESMWIFLKGKDMFVCLPRWVREKCLLQNSFDLINGTASRSNITISPSHKTFLYFGTVSTPHARQQLYKVIITIIARPVFSSCHMIMVEFVGYPTFQRNYLLYYSSPDTPFRSIGGAALARLDLMQCTLSSPSPLVISVVIYLSHSIFLKNHVFTTILIAFIIYIYISPLIFLKGLFVTISSPYIFLPQESCAVQKSPSVRWQESWMKWLCLHTVLCRWESAHEQIYM